MEKRKHLRDVIQIPDCYQGTQSVKWIATQYMPTIEPKSASRWLRREIALNPELQSALVAAGWSSSKHNFTPLQLELLVYHMGPFW